MRSDFRVTSVFKGQGYNMIIQFVGQAFLIWNVFEKQISESIELYGVSSMWQENFGTLIESLVSAELFKINNVTMIYVTIKIFFTTLVHSRNGCSWLVFYKPRIVSNTAVRQKLQSAPGTSEISKERNFWTFYSCSSFSTSCVLVSVRIGRPI